MTWLPALSREFHLSPVDVWDCTHDELETYLAELERMSREAKKSARKRRNRRR